MRKNVFGKQFKRDSNERKALFKGLLSSLVIHERIRTTEHKAKAIKADADKLITKAKKGGLHAKRLLEPELNHIAVKKLIDEIAPRFISRQGGYTRIIKIGNRGKDNAAMAIMEWTEKAPQLPVTMRAGKVKKAPKQSGKKEEVQLAAAVSLEKKTAKVASGVTKPKTEKKPKAQKTAKKEEKK